MHIKFFSVLLSFVLFMTSHVQAQKPLNQHVNISLIANVETVAPGTSFDLILRQDIDDHWHTYWKNPGESGFPIQGTWDMPEGVRISDFLWPVPMALNVEGIMNFVHEGTTDLVVDVQVPDDFTGDTLTLSIQADWLVCKEVCIPESGNASISIPVGDTTVWTNTDIFETAYKALPTPHDTALKATIMTDNKDKTLTVTLQENTFIKNLDVNTPVILFSYDWGLVKAGSHAEIKKDGDLIHFTFPRTDRALTEIETFNGILAQGNTAIPLDIEAPASINHARTTQKNPVNTEAPKKNSVHKIMPKPGAWMETFKQFLAFPMFATVIWLTWVLGQQSGTQGMLAVLYGLFVISTVVWVLPKGGWVKGVCLFLCTLFTIQFFLSSPFQKPQENILAYTPATLETALQSDAPVFVNMTAAWCITCKVNERVIKSSSIASLFAQKGVTYIEGDWTLMNKDITKYLESFDRTGVPLYVYYKADDRNNPVLLPQILTPTILKETIE